MTHRIYPNWLKLPHSSVAHQLAETLRRIADRVDQPVKFEKETTMKTEICNTLRRHLQHSAERHRMNVKIMLNNPMAIHEHTDFMAALELELAQIAEYKDKLEALEYVMKD